MSSGNGDSEPASVKKPGRGPTKIKHVVNKSNKEVQFDKLGRPIINEQTTSYSTQLGILVRAQVSIRFKEWSEVPDLVKKKIWHEYKLAWNLPDNDDMKKNVYQRMGVAFRKFRNRLYNDYMKEDKTPFLDYTAITQEDWDLFVKYHQSDEFEGLSKIGRANQSNSLYPHFLGSRGYNGEKFQKRLKEALTEIASKEGSSSDLSSQGSTTELSQDQLVDMSIQHRHVPWKLARHKVSDGANVYPNPETAAMIKTIDEQEKAFDQGMMTADGYDDILGNSLPNREHPGRVRGVGSLVGIKKTYKGCGKRKRCTSSESEASIQERIQREVQERIQIEVQERMKPILENQEALMRQMAMLMSQQVDKGNPLVSSPKAVQSPLMQPPHFLDCIEEECKCKLYLVRDGQKIQVAVGTINPSLQGTAIHGRLMPPDHARVMVDDCVAGEDDTPVPVPNGEVETLRSALSSFTAWPKDLISLDEEPRKELQVPPSGTPLHIDAFAPHEYKKFDGLNFDKLGPVFKKLRDRFLKKVGHEFLIDLPVDLFHSEEDPISSISVHADDLKDLLTPETWLPAPIIQIFMLYAHRHYKEEFPNELVGFMDPAKTCWNFLTGGDENREYADKYIRKALKENRDKKIIFIPYHQIDHWVLVVLMVRESTLYVFDSMAKSSKALPIIKALADPYRIDRCIGGIGKSATLKVIQCKCPQQKGGWECGYYVMLFMHDIITRFLDVFPNLKEFPNSYNETNIDYIRMLWGKFFLKEVLVEKSKTI